MSEIFTTEAPFSPLERAALQPLLSALTVEQRAYLARALSGAAPAASAPAKKTAVTIYFGTESGNSEELAARTGKELKKAGFATKVKNLADIQPADLAKDEYALVVVSTWGEGDPPEAVEPFFKQLGTLPKLDKLSYSICALGDTSYEHFCQTGKDLDAALSKQGATALVPRVDCDVDFDEPFAKWLADVKAALPQAGAPAPAANGFAAPAAAVEYGRKNPFPAEVLEKIKLNGPGTQKETYHLALSLEESGLDYQPGDVLALIPENDPALVEEILAVTKLDADASVTVPSGTKPLVDALRQDYDVTTLSKAIAGKLAKVAGDEKLTALTADADAIKAYAKERQLIDLLLEFDFSKATPEAFVGALRKLPPRLYSIASSHTANPGEVHLTIAAVRYELHGRQRKGVASTYCADQIAAGDKVLVYTQVNKNFRLPEDPATKIIMVGPGTGVAPFRAFVQERSLQENAGESWLFFGDQRYLYDFLYQLEWQDHLKDGALTKLDVAFSRDQPEKIYVQDRIRERGEELYQWLEGGAHFYVCGDASRMAGDVHQALIDIYQAHGGLTAEDAESKLADLKKARRYQRDVY